MSTFATESKLNRFRSCSSKTGLIHFGFSGGTSGGIPGVLFFFYPDFSIHHYNPRIDMNKNEKKRKELSYYHLYLQKHLQENRFEQAGDASFIETRADLAATAYEQARREGYPIEGAQELAMQTLLKGLHHSKYAILREVITNEFAYEIPETQQEALSKKLLPLVDSVFSIYDLSDDYFAQSLDYDLLYSELTGAVVLYLAEYGV